MRGSHIITETAANKIKDNIGLSKTQSRLCQAWSAGTEEERERGIKTEKERRLEHCIIRESQIKTLFPQFRHISSHCL